jgi:hypothetical protein
MKPHPDSPPPAFEPVALRYRRDGWTPERQRAFIAALAATGCVLAACRLVGISPEAAYRLCRRADAAGFRAAWDAALSPRLGAPAPAAAAVPAGEPIRPGEHAHRPRPAIAPLGTAPSAAASRQASTSPSSSTSEGRWQLSESPASSTSPPPASAPSASAAGAPPARARPAYSLEAFARIAWRAGIARQAKGKAPQ